MGTLPLSRRDFLKLSAAGMLGAWLADLRLDRALAAPVTQGRMTLSGIALYANPSFKSKQLHLFGRDEVVSVTAEVQGDYGNPYNNEWFQINGEGYSYSGWIQPVQTVYQKPIFTIPAKGQLGEVTVPFSITRHQAGLWADTGYRVYYATTYWVKGIAVDPHEKSIWYQIYDEHLHESLYVAASDMRLVPDSELAPLSPDVPPAMKQIHMDTATQLVTAFEGQNAVLTARCSSGGKGTKTPLGNFLTFHKGPTIHMTNDGAPGAGHGYDLPGVPWVSFFTGTGISFHGTYWHNDYGTPRSHGCVNLLPADAKFIYRWTSPVVPPDVSALYQPGQGTAVQIASSNA